MCGIVGYTGTRPVKDILIEGLSRLEYRGYDSAGIAVEQDGKLEGRPGRGRGWNYHCGSAGREDSD